MSAVITTHFCLCAGCCAIGMRPIDRIARVNAPLLVIGGDADSIVPIAQTRRVFEAARDPKSLLVIDGADHNDDSLLNGREMIDSVLRFLRNLARSLTMADAIVVRDLVKTFKRRGQPEVRAVDGLDLLPCGADRYSDCSGRTAPAKPRRSRC